MPFPIEKDVYTLYHLNISNNMRPLLRLAHGAPYFFFISGAQLGSDFHTRDTLRRLAPNVGSLWDFSEGYCLRHSFYF